MAEILVPFKKGWISDKDSREITKETAEIIQFYLWATPCDNVSSSGKSMKERGWKNNVWKQRDLREYLYLVALLKKDNTLKKVTKLEDMKEAVNKIGLGDSFQNKRDCNRIVYYNNGKKPDFIQIMFYIRCAIAHGRFSIYTDEEETVYVMEVITKKRGTTKYSLRARMVLFESTLLEWKKIIMEGQKNYNSKKQIKLEEIHSEIIKVIGKKDCKKKIDIVAGMEYEEELIYKEIKTLRENNRIKYDNSKRKWILFRN